VAEQAKQETTLNSFGFGLAKTRKKEDDDLIQNKSTKGSSSNESW
jgi:hypothetical protein